MTLHGITLTGEQERIYKQPYTGTLLIKGAAGSGKTVVAAKRTQFLCKMEQLQPDLLSGVGEVFFTTYNKELTAELNSMVGGYTNLTTRNIDSYIYRFLKERGCSSYLGLIETSKSENDLSTMLFTEEREEKKSQQKPSKPSQCLAQAMLEIRRKEALVANDSVKKFLLNSQNFFEGEITYIKGLGITDSEEYYTLNRAGRGKTTGTIRRDAREVVWKIFTRYNSIMKENNLYDFDDRVNIALDITQQPAFAPPFKHVVVDEAQDLSLQKLRFLKSLVQPGGSLTLVADMGQRIYNTSFTWKDAGIMVHSSKSFELKRNHRNTLEIAKAAAAIRENIDTEFNEEDAKTECSQIELPTRTGTKPQLFISRDKEANAEKLREKLALLPSNETVIVVRTRERVSAWESYLKHFGFTHPVKTFHAIKGFSIPHIVMPDSSKGNLSHSEDEEKNTKNRTLFYVGVSRATQSVTFFSDGEPCFILDEIDPELLDTEGTPEAEKTPLNTSENDDEDILNLLVS